MTFHFFDHTLGYSSSNCQIYHLVTKLGNGRQSGAEPKTVYI